MGIPDSNPFHKVKITEYGLTSDTIFLEHIQEVNHFNYNPPWSEYLCCGGKCNGFESSYYENGNLRTQGKFYNGQPTGNLAKYYYTGELREKYTFDKNIRVFRHYDLNGQLREIFSNKRISKYPYWVIKKAEYFNSSGLISMIAIYKRGDIKRQIKYDFEGNKVYEAIRNKRIDYFKDGSVRCKLRWHKGIIQYEYCWRRF